jgi:electron transport complex protein RnfA
MRPWTRFVEAGNLLDRRGGHWHDPRKLPDRHASVNTNRTRVAEKTHAITRQHTQQIDKLWVLSSVTVSRQRAAIAQTHGIRAKSVSNKWNDDNSPWPNRSRPGKSMTEYALILISTVLVNNFVLVKFLGLCPFMGVSRKLETAMGMGLATTFVLTLSSVSSYLVNAYILVPLDVEYLRTIAFILVIAAVVQFTEMVMHKTSPLLYQVLGIFLPLITTNCAVLGVALLNIQEQHSFVESALYGFGAAVGFSLVLVLFAAVRERVAVADVPAPFQGNAVALITAGLMSMAFMGFAGLVSG